MKTLLVALMLLLAPCLYAGDVILPTTNTERVRALILHGGTHEGWTLTSTKSSVTMTYNADRTEQIRWTFRATNGVTLLHCETSRFEQGANAKMIFAMEQIQSAITAGTYLTDAQFYSLIHK